MKRKIQFFLSRNPSIYRCLLHAIQSPNSEKTAFLKLVKNRDIVFDIGGNIGNYSLLFSDIVGQHGSVHVFEPVPPTFANLERRLRKNGHFQNLVLNNIALGEIEGTFPISVPSGDFGQASLKDHAHASWASSGRDIYTCRVRRLDDYVAEQNITRVDFLKIDVEGAELPALRGAQSTLEKLKPVVHFEYFSQWTTSFGYSAESIVTFLSGLGYRFFYDEKFRIMESPAHEIESCSGSQNVVCSHNSL